MRCLVSPEPFAERPPPRALFDTAFPEAALPETALMDATLPRAVRLFALRPLLDGVEDDVAFLIGSRLCPKASRRGQDARSATTDRASRRQVMRSCSIISPALDARP